MREYFRRFGIRILENLASAKMWFFLLPFIISTIYLGYTLFVGIGFAETVLMNEATPEGYNTLVALFGQVKDTFISWCTFNVSLASAIVVVRETFKVQKLKQLKDESKKWWMAN